MCKGAFLVPLLALACCATPPSPSHTFAIGKTDFLLDGKPFVIRSGEMHAPRVPPEYWRHRLQMIKAMGCNTVCAYLFWNQHEPEEGRWNFAGATDAAAYCRIAQEVGLWVILRPGPYSCAEWEFGGFPYWLLNRNGLKLRTRDPQYLAAVDRYLQQVGEQLAPLQVTRGGPILMTQVENEYGSYGNDKEYIGALAQSLRKAGFDVPLFTCDGPSQLKNDTRDDLFCVVNFGGNPDENFKALRAIRPEGPLMCGEYYPGWFDSWGKPHHRGDTARIQKELESMLVHRQSFSIYMVHGGTSFGFTAGANSPPFAPQTTSYDYDAPIDEAGRPTPKFFALRELLGRHLEAWETLPDVPPAPLPVVAIPPVVLDRTAPLEVRTPPTTALRRDLPATFEPLGSPSPFQQLWLPLPAGPAGVLELRGLHDFAQVWLDGCKLGELDRRHRLRPLAVPARKSPQTLCILVEAFGRVNYGGDLHDRKGIVDGIWFTGGGRSQRLQEFHDAHFLPVAWPELQALPFAGGLPRSATWPADLPAAPCYYRGSFELPAAGDTFLDLRAFHRGVVWVNGHNLGRYWSVGPTQTMYLPGCWLRAGSNEVIVFDAEGGIATPKLEGLTAPILDQVQADPLAEKPHRKPTETLELQGLQPLASGTLADRREADTVTFAATEARWLCLQATGSHQQDQFTTLAELTVLDGDGQPIPRDQVAVVYADSEEMDGDSGSAGNVLDGDPASFWHTQWQANKPKHPHQLVVDLGRARAVTGLRLLPRQDSRNGRIAGYQLFASTTPFPGLIP